MSGMDWVPSLTYGQELVLITGTTRSRVDLLMSGDLDVDVIGKVEDTDDLFVHRIVGEVYFSETGRTSGGRLTWGIMPVQEDFSEIDADAPWDLSGDMFNEPEIANLRFWHIRNLVASGTAYDNWDATGSGHITPWHFHVDIKPRQKFGSRLNLWPAMFFSTTDADSQVRVAQYLRLLCSGR